MSKILIAAFLFLFAMPAAAQNWEYRVVMLSNPVVDNGNSGFLGMPNPKPRPDLFVKQADGTTLVINQTDELNNLAEQGWDVLDIETNTIWTYVYLRRAKQ